MPKILKVFLWILGLAVLAYTSFYLWTAWQRGKKVAAALNAFRTPTFSQEIHGFLLVVGLIKLPPQTITLAGFNPLNVVLPFVGFVL